MAVVILFTVLTVAQFLLINAHSTKCEVDTLHSKIHVVGAL